MAWELDLLPKVSIDASDRFHPDRSQPEMIGSVGRDKQLKLQPPRKWMPLAQQVVQSPNDPSSVALNAGCRLSHKAAVNTPLPSHARDPSVDFMYRHDSNVDL
jgi:hypothetical protein